MCSRSHGVSTGNNKFKVKQRRSSFNMINDFPTVAIEKWQCCLKRAQNIFRGFSGRKKASIIYLFHSGESLSSLKARKWTRSHSRYSCHHKLCRSLALARALVPRYPLRCHWCSQQGSVLCWALSWGLKLQRLVSAVTMDTAFASRGKSIQLHWPQGHSTGHGPVAFLGGD